MRAWNANTITAQLAVFLGYAFGTSVIVYMIALDIKRDFPYHHTWQLLLLYTLMLPVLLISLYALYITPFTLNAIYENGVSSVNHTLIDFIKRRTFHRYDDIRKIEVWNKKSENGTRMQKKILIYENDSNKPSLTFTEFIKNGSTYAYKNDFLNVLEKHLKDKCPNAKWIVKSEPLSKEEEEFIDFTFKYT